MMSSNRKLLICSSMTLFVFALVSGACGWWASNESPDRSGRSSRTTSHPISPKPAPVEPMRPVSGQSLESVLIDAGWESGAAGKFAVLIGKTLGDPEQPGPHQRHLTLLKELGKHPGAMPLLEEHPELAGLLAAIDKPLRLVRIFANRKTQPFHQLAGLYQRYVDAGDRELLTIALEENGDLILELLDLGMLGSEQLFFFRRTTAADRHYERWIVDLLRRHVLAPRATEVERAEFQTFLFGQGDDIRRRMHDDAEFHRRFPGELWPRFEKLAAADRLWDFYADSPGLWKILALDDGVELLDKYLVLPGALLYGRQALPQDLHMFALGILRDGRELPVAALGQFFHLSEFHSLLRRKLTTTALNNLFAELLQKSSDREVVERLTYYARLSESALHKDYGGVAAGPVSYLPGYNVWRLIDKQIDGRDSSTGDWIDAGFDVGGLVLPAGKAGPILRTTLGNTARQQGEKAALQQLERYAARSGTSYARQLAKQTAKSTRQKALPASFERTVILRDLQPLIRGLDENRMLDITQAVKVLFTHSGVGRRSFKVITELEARLFMRKDARVLISLPQLARKAIDLRERLKQVVDESAEASAEDSRQAWRRNAAAWWLYRLDPND